MTKKYKLTALMLCLAMLFGLTACGSGSSTAESYAAPETTTAATTGNATDNGAENVNADAAPVAAEGPTTLVYGADAEMAGIDPFDTQNQGGQAINEAIYEKLIEPRDDGTYYMRLASNYEWQDDNTLVFTLREGVTFQNGAAFTAEDALKSIAHMSEMTMHVARFAVIDMENSYCDGD